MLEVANWLVVVDTVSIADNSLGKRYRTLQVLYHPRFNRYNNDYDVGLLRTITDINMRGKRRCPLLLAGPSTNTLCACVLSYLHVLRYKNKSDKIFF